MPTPLTGTLRMPTPLKTQNAHRAEWDTENARHAKNTNNAHPAEWNTENAHHAEYLHSKSMKGRTRIPFGFVTILSVPLASGGHANN